MKTGEEITSFCLEPETLPDEFRAGGRLSLLIGKELTKKAQDALGVNYDIFIKSREPGSFKSRLHTGAKDRGKSLRTSRRAPGAVMPSKNIDSRVTGYNRADDR